MGPAKMIVNWLRKRSLAARSKFIILAFNLPDQSSHFFNELLGYKIAAEELGLSTRIFVPRNADPPFVQMLSADPVLDPLPSFSPINSNDIASKLDAFLETPKILEPLWTLIEDEDLSQIRAILCPQPNPALIRAVGLWLQHHQTVYTPAVFFRFTNTFALATKPPVTDLILFSRLAGMDLNTRLGQERIYFLVNGTKMARSVMRVCNRRAFVVPMPKHYGEVRAPSRQPAQVIVYIHLNSRSGSLIQRVGEIIRNTKAAHPHARFLLKFTKYVGVNDASALIDADIAPSVEVLPVEQSRDEYLANLLRSSVVVLAYESDIYITGTSGVFAEAVGLGNPVVVPVGTWMAQELGAGRGVGTVFAEATPKAIATALSEALQKLEELRPAAEQLAPAVRAEHSAKRVLESMLALAKKSLDMEPRYGLGEEID
jgi:hypothetical protein